MSWKAHGYSGRDSVAGLIDSLQGCTAIVCGNARGVFEELLSLYPEGQGAVIFAVNDVGLYLPRVDHWVSFHSDKLKVWDKLKQTGTAVPKRWVCHTGGTYGADAEYNWYGTEPTTFPLSGELAMQIAYLMGAERIILCGCPMDETPRFFEAECRGAVGNDGFRYGAGTTGSDNAQRTTMLREMKRLPEFKAKVRSMSGWSQRYFGSIDSCDDAQDITKSHFAIVQ
jgi:hypothetical protein